MDISARLEPAMPGTFTAGSGTIQLVRDAIVRAWDVHEGLSLGTRRWMACSIMSVGSPAAKRRAGRTPCCRTRRTCRVDESASRWYYDGRHHPPRLPQPTGISVLSLRGNDRA